MKQKLARLEAIEASYNRIVASYRDYAAKEDSLVSAKGEDALVEAKLHLNAFLASGEESFPGCGTASSATTGPSSRPAAPGPWRT